MGFLVDEKIASMLQTLTRKDFFLFKKSPRYGGLVQAIQYNACLAIKGCFRGTSQEKIYSELGLESFADRRFARKIILLFCKIVNNLALISFYSKTSN